jgi:hypothetical protein
MLERSLLPVLSRLIPAFFIFLGLVTPVFAAGPHIIMISGQSLPKPVILSDWNQNQQFLASFTDGEIVKTEDLKGRSYLELSLFWGPEWLNYLKSNRSLDGLRSEQANQQGRFYLATDTAGAVVSLNSTFARRVNADGMRFLAEKGVPVRYTAPNSSGLSLPFAGRFLTITLLLAAAVALLILFGKTRGFWHIRTKA